jgi:hypothetical protein
MHGVLKSRPSLTASHLMCMSVLNLECTAKLFDRLLDLELLGRNSRVHSLPGVILLIYLSGEP